MIGGLGDAISRFYRNSGRLVYSLGYGEEFIPHGTVSSLMRQRGLSKENLIRIVKDLYARR